MFIIHRIAVCDLTIEASLSGDRRWVFYSRSPSLLSDGMNVFINVDCNLN